MPDTILGFPAFLFLTALFFAIVISVGLIRGGGGGPPRSGTAGIGNKIQLISAVLGILSFFMQVMQWLDMI
jgi:hypothetical protein